MKSSSERLTSNLEIPSHNSASPIVPGNQLYLPTFGMELRESFRQAKIPTDNLSPLAQATILFAIYHKHDLPIPMQRMAQLSNCSKMSISRSFSELETLDLVTIEKDCRSRELQLTRTPKESWEFGTKFWRTPVRKRLRVFHDFPIPERSRVAGQTALASRTDISKGVSVDPLSLYLSMRDIRDARTDG